jgi:SAM-dependent methyltransferase
MMDKSRMAVNLFDRLALLYQEKYMDVGMYHELFDIFCNSISSHNAEVLELGCGPGNITKYLLQKRPDLNILGTDLAPAMIELARMNNPRARFELMDCRDIGGLKNKYHALMCGFCLPYLSKEEAIQLIADSSKILADDGVIYLSFMEDEYIKSGLKKSSTGDELYMHYHEGQYILEALHIANFTIIDTQRKVTDLTDGAENIDLIIIAKK